MSTTDGYQFNRVSFRARLSDRGIPGYMVDGLLLYLFDGCRPGDFLYCILANDFAHAAAQADAANSLCLFQWAGVLLNAVPVTAWGSRERVAAWVEGGGFVGRKLAAPRVPAQPDPLKRAAAKGVESLIRPEGEGADHADAD